MNAKAQYNTFSLMTSLVLLFVVAVAVVLLSTLAAWVINLPVETASAAPASSPTPAAATDSSSPLPTPEPTVIPTLVAPTAIPTAVAPTAIPTTIAPTVIPPADPPTDQPANSPTNPLSHTVQEGDTLGAIAQAYGVSVEDLAAANGLDDPDLLYVGWTLIVPDGSPILPTDSTSTAGQGPNPTEVPAQPTPIPLPASPQAINEERWIDVDLSEQLLTAYEGHTPIHSYLVSTGLPDTPTPVGQFRIWIKLRYDDMAGADYYIEDVPFVMYFHEGYGLHGVTWHANFGHPMSHGCVNQPNDEAEWLFNFAGVGTLVNIHD
jgi:lipoprotein-anchoring transpeptidase ErfK/SrfK